MERIPAENFHDHRGHVARYRWAGERLNADDVVNDIACGVGYGAALLPVVRYRGYDKAGVPDVRFPGAFYAADLDDPDFMPLDTDVTCCFETLEHVREPQRLAKVIAETTRRSIFVSVPTVPTKHVNPFHLHDFTPEDIPPMFGGWTVREVWHQVEELSHVWWLGRAGD